MEFLTCSNSSERSSKLLSSKVNEVISTISSQFFFYEKISRVQKCTRPTNFLSFKSFYAQKMLHLLPLLLLSYDNGSDHKGTNLSNFYGFYTKNLDT